MLRCEFTTHSWLVVMALEAIWNVFMDGDSEKLDISVLATWHQRCHFQVLTSHGFWSGPSLGAVFLQLIVEKVAVAVSFFGGCDCSVPGEGTCFTRACFVADKMDSRGRRRASGDNYRHS